ncbi:acetylornithine deacetylase [Polymorphum gilvum]|uniref:Acetylornithine deacetylase (ArgE) n=1 Tax=Polymorphum gilvum (strain LMG 25793 / CGMCC 1.9160 / SL003B-26A1) TaxID=991905 RepID=F2J4C9_POLGS|nr:acetylornithine deacetylase [Polymorphum gilvum]ADZ71071.1 Acetylornithine deacetylase (ArgE) [Polymorphum gilvum SL003B-26A1]
MTVLDETKAILADLIAFPTVSTDSNLDLIAYAGERLSACGARLALTRDETGQKANLYASLGPETAGGVVLAAHTDVVPAGDDWTSDPFTLREAGGRLYGRGSCDMKGFLAAMLAMAPRYAALDLRHPVHLALTYDEEVGCFGARQLVADLAGHEMLPSMAIIGEPTMMRIIEGHKGSYEYTTRFSGLDGHGSDPDSGVNAITYAAKFISRLMEIGEDLKARAPAGSRFHPPWTTVQVGRIGGGTARNVIPRHCEIDWEIRPVQEADATFVKAALAAYCARDLLPRMRAVAADAGIETTVIGEVEALDARSDNPARDLVASLTGANSFDVVPFGTEAGLYQGLGLSVVVCGPGSIEQAHKPDEYLAVDQLEACLAMLSRLGRHLEA